MNKEQEKQFVDAMKMLQKLAKKECNAEYKPGIYFSIGSILATMSDGNEDEYNRLNKLIDED